METDSQALLINLSYKFLEGIFVPAPRIWNYLDVAHGPLQQWSYGGQSAKKNLVVLTTASDDSGVVSRLIATLDSAVQNGAVAQYDVIESLLPAHWAIIEFEILFSYFVVSKINEFGIDQIDWPAKGLDSELYNWGKQQEGIEDE